MTATRARRSGSLVSLVRRLRIGRPFVDVDDRDYYLHCWSLQPLGIGSGSQGGALAGCFWLALPAVVHYAHILLSPSPAILLMVASVLAFHRAYASALFAFLAVCTSWNAVSAAPVYG